MFDVRFIIMIVCAGCKYHLSIRLFDVMKTHDVIMMLVIIAILRHSCAIYLIYFGLLVNIII
jgi:hypothetical protein